MAGFATLYIIRAVDMYHFYYPLLCFFPIQALISFVVPAVTLNFCIYHDIIALQYSFSYVPNKSSVHPYDEFFIICTEAARAIFKLWSATAAV